MLSLYRRHKPKCKLASKGIDATNCPCPIWTYGSVRGMPVRQSLKTKDWTFAHRLMVQLEAGRPVNDAPVEITISRSIEAYLDDCEARQIKARTLVSYRQGLTKFVRWAEVKNLTFSKLSVDLFTEYRAMRTGTGISGNTQIRELVILRMWLHFCIARGWTVQNFAKSIRLPKQTAAPTLPFSREQTSALIKACDLMGDPIRMRAAVLTLLYSGLRISDLIQLKRTQLEPDGRLLLRMEKTGAPVYVRLSEDCMEALRALPVMTGAQAEYFFMEREKVDTVISATRIQLSALGKVAGVPDCHPHRFRDTFSVELLVNGADIRTVQKLLGHTSLSTTEKHYAPWVTAMQAKLDAETSKLKFG